MTAKTPPVPPENQPKKGPAAARGADRAPKDETIDAGERNLEEQGRQGNIHQNTHNQGYQQDR
jgi:hypothetical protein